MKLQSIIQKSLNLHTVMHRTRSSNDFWYKCPLASCQSSFHGESLLNLHLRIHNNDFKQCQYCPYKYIFSNDYQKHLKNHFGIKDFECEQCGKTFASAGQLNEHFAMHEGIIYSCLLCNAYQGSTKRNIGQHLRLKHTEIVGKYLNSEEMQQYINIIK